MCNNMRLTCPGKQWHVDRKHLCVKITELHSSCEKAWGSPKATFVKFTLVKVGVTPGLQLLQLDAPRRKSGTLGGDEQSAMMLYSRCSFLRIDGQIYSLDYMSALVAHPCAIPTIKPWIDTKSLCPLGSSTEMQKKIYVSSRSPHYERLSLSRYQNPAQVSLFHFITHSCVRFDSLYAPNEQI